MRRFVSRKRAASAGEHARGAIQRSKRDQRHVGLTGEPIDVVHDVLHRAITNSLSSTR